MDHPRRPDVHRRTRQLPHLTQGRVSGLAAAGPVTGYSYPVLPADLTGAGRSLKTRFSQFQQGEQVTLLPFSTTPGQPRTFDVPERNPGMVLTQIRSYADSLSPGGWTAIYSALESAYRIIAHQMAADPNRITTIVLLTDGENNRSADLAAFSAFYHSLPEAPASAPVFPRRMPSRWPGWQRSRAAMSSTPDPVTRPRIPRDPR